VIELCLERVSSRSAYNAIQPRYCQCGKGHSGPHDEFPYLRELARAHPLVANKIKRDATMTTGAAWKSAEAGPNRILRWVMLLPDEALKSYGINMAALKPQVVGKLREKAATYDDCMSVARKLTWLVHGMSGAPALSSEVRSYLEAHFGIIEAGATCCIVCRESLSFDLFAKAMRGRAEIETGHLNPRRHNAHNVGFAHRECNIAQGSKTLPEFYRWIETILIRVCTGQGHDNFADESDM
jgi:hypothetical protein